MHGRRKIEDLISDWFDRLKKKNTSTLGPPPSSSCVEWARPRPFLLTWLRLPIWIRKRPSECGVVRSLPLDSMACFTNGQDWHSRRKVAGNSHRPVLEPADARGKWAGSVTRGPPQISCFVLFFFPVHFIDVHPVSHPFRDLWAPSAPVLAFSFRWQVFFFF